MGLFEQIQRAARRKGLTEKLMARIMLYLSFAAVIAGIACLFILPLEGQHRRTYISENALMPAQAHTYFRESEWYILRGYREEVKLLKDSSESERSEALLAWFNSLGLKSSTQNWESRLGTNEVINGTNIYGIMHSPRGDSTEAMVLVAPWINQDGQFNDGGVALVIALARYFKRWNIWSKNIIFVITSDSHASLRSWVTAYHTSLKNTAGSIEGALVLDYPEPSDYVDAVEIFYDGLNGQLSNLDLFNSAVLIAKHESFPVVINGVNSSFVHYSDKLKTLLKGIFRQIFSGITAGPGSENFSGWKIDAITIRGRGTKGPMDITSFGRIAESLFRSINNLLEHFHQSFFFYLLLSPKHFVSIGTYLPSAMLIANSFPLIGISLAISTRNLSGNLSSTIPLFLALSISGGCIMFGYAMMSLSSSVAPIVFAASGALIYLASSLLGPLLVLNRTTVYQTFSIILVFHGLYLTTLATVNFSLSLALGLVTFPLAWVRPEWSSIKSSSILILLSPWAGLYAIAVYTNNSWSTIITGLLWGWRSLDLWTYGIIIVIWMPIWVSAVLMSKVRIVVGPNVSEERKKA